MPQVEVTFDVDSNGILTVKAKEKTTGKEQSIRIEGSTGLSKEDIERMKTEAETHAADDEKRKSLVEARNTAEQMIYAAEKAVKENGEKVGAETVKEVEDNVAALKTAAAGEDADAIKTASDALSASMSKIGEVMMKQEQDKAAPAEGGEPAQEGSGEQPPEGGATDAEFKEKE